MAHFKKEIKKDRGKLRVKEMSILDNLKSCLAYQSFDLFLSNLLLRGGIACNRRRKKVNQAINLSKCGTHFVEQFHCLFVSRLLI